jgi:GNAT superfamily N-acetyltransferase
MQIREIRPADYARFAVLFSQHHQGRFAVTAEQLASCAPLTRFVVTDGGGVLAGAGISTQPGYQDGRRLDIYTESDDAWDFANCELTARLKADGVARVLAVVREDQSACRRLEAAGFKLTWQSWAAHLHLDGPVADSVYREIPAETAHPVREVAPTDHEAAFRLYDATYADFPRTPATTPAEHSAESFHALLEHSRAFAVIDNATCLALTVMTVDGDVAETEFTVVAAAHRRTGLAKLVKATAIRALATEGVRTFGTGGAAANEGSLRMNLSLGYVLDPKWRTYEYAIQRGGLVLGTG